MGEAAAWSGDDAEVTGGVTSGRRIRDPAPAAAAGQAAAGDASQAGRAGQDGGHPSGVDADEEAPSRTAGSRSKLSTLRASWPPQQWPLAIVVCGIGLSLLIVAVDDFRPGTVLFAGSLLLGALLRLVLPDRQAGLLVMRSRAIDVLLMLIMGLCILLLALLVPDLPAGPLPAVQQ